MRIAAVTMAYNEAEYVPLWLRHYDRQIGAAHCHLIDHGSDDGSTDGLKEVNVVRLPRSPQDDPRRARFISGYCAALLEWYDAVLYTDIDELLLADPHHFADLRAFAAETPDNVATAVGLDIHQVPALEAAFEPTQPVGAQRRWARFNAALCKPALIRRPVRWAPGFHCADAPMVFGGLYLFHLRYYDFGRGLQRLAKTRAMPWAVEGAGTHQRMSDVDWSGMFHAIAALPRREGLAFNSALDPIRASLDRLRASMLGREADVYSHDLTLSGEELWEIPSRFRAAL